MIEGPKGQHEMTEPPSQMINVKLDYIWVDGQEPKTIRSKTKYVKWDLSADGGEMSRESVLEKIPEWSFDGSSTNQAEGTNSDCLLIPVKVYQNVIDGTEIPSFFVLCEVYDAEGIPHKSNTRNLVHSLPDNEMLFGIEQEYVFVNPVTGNPYSWDEYSSGTPRPQGDYYCGVGSNNAVCRDIVQAHAEACMHTDLNYEGNNAEVMLSQWEYQIGICNALDVADDLVMSRYLLQRIAEHFGVGISYDPKLVEGDWNGSGAHINFSTKHLREEGGEDYIESLCEALEETHNDHISVYGTGNERRLTGDHETAHIGSYSWGKGDRGASIRIPAETSLNGKGYLEDRRPAANIDPYEAVYKLTDTVLKLHDKINSFKGQLVDVTA